jgi:hypothetical protein
MHGGIDKMDPFRIDCFRERRELEQHWIRLLTALTAPMWLSYRSTSNPMACPLFRR